MRAGRTIKWAAGACGGIAVLLGLLLYTPPGLALAGRLVRPLSGGTVTVEGLSGSFPNHLHVQAVTVSDSAGAWLTVADASLDWSALAMLGNHVVVANAAASRVVVLRRPAPSAESQGETPRIDVAHFSAKRIEIAAAVMGQSATLAAGGSLQYRSRHDFAADIAVSRLGNSDAYRIAGGIRDDVARGEVAVREGDDGILARLLDLPGLGPVNLSARADGTRDANSLSFTLSAGPLRANGHGMIALTARRADLDFSATAPAMRPRPDMGWQSLAAEGHIHGAFDGPGMKAHLTIMGATAAGFGARTLTADVTGNAGSGDLNGRAEGVALAGTYPDLFAQTPLLFKAHLDLKAPTRPVTFTLRHKLVSLAGKAQTSGNQNLEAQLTIPSLAPFAALQNVDLRGDATAHLTLSQAGHQLKFGLNGRANTGGTAVAARLLGRGATLDFTALIEGSDLADSSIHLHGAALDARVNGNFRKGVLDYRLALGLSDVSRLAPALQGTVALQGSAHGPLDRASLSASGGAVLATRGFDRQRVAIALQATGLPTPRDARLTLNGHFDGAPLALHATLRGGKARNIAITARWKSLDAKAGIVAPENAPVSGTAHVALTRLADIAAFTGGALGGTAEADITFKARGAQTDATWQASLKNIQIATAGAGAVTLHGSAADLFGKRILDVSFTGHDMAAYGVTGDVNGHLSGPAGELAVQIESRLKDSSGMPAQLSATAQLDVPGKHLRLANLNGDWRGLALALRTPAIIDFSDGLALTGLSARLGSGTLTASGRLLPRLAFKAEAKGLALKDFGAVLPQTGIQGSVSAQASLDGTFAAPQGTITAQGRDLRTAATSRSLPSASLDGRALLHGDGATVQITLAAGTSARLAVHGEMPLAPGGTIALHAGGSADLALLDTLVAASGRRVRGLLALDGDIGGTLAAPRVNGNGKLSGGEVQDFARGIRIQDISATFQADNSHLRISDLTGHAGPGTLTGSGSIDLAAPGMPVDFTVSAKNARPLASDLLTMTFSGDGKLGGTLNDLSLSGAVQVLRGEINLPENFPPDVAVLNVRRRGQKALPPPPARGRMRFDVRVTTSGPIFVRGHGMDAEMGGEIHLGGSDDAPNIGGSFRMNRGSYSFAGQTLEFTSGRIGFDGTGVRGQLDPSLDFAAQTVSGGVTATLNVGGYASAPKITLSSTPQLPQDEVLAHLLFQQSAKQLSPLQLASIAQGLGSLGGLGGGFNPLGVLRRTMGLDRLAVGNTTGGANGTQEQTTVEAGRYVTRNVYVGVKQNLSGGTQTQVQIDITRRLKAQATVSANTNATVTKGSAIDDTGSSVGLSYQFEY